MTVVERFNSVLSDKTVECFDRLEINFEPSLEIKKIESELKILLSRKSRLLQELLGLQQS